MFYSSSRGLDGHHSFRDVTELGLAMDGGLYLPEPLPRLDDILPLDKRADLSYPEFAYHVMRPFVGDSLSSAQLEDIIARAYGVRFCDTNIAPVRRLDQKRYVLELFHGPTLAFKDMALQILALLFDAFRSSGEKRTILGATSGDTGSAAIEACRGRSGLNVIMLHPHGRVSEIQRKQMTTVQGDNIFNIAVDGSFDDCQALVKDAFGDRALRGKCGLTAVNSINWARVMAQIVYYISSSLSLQAKGIVAHYSVPTGNFGDIFAGYLAKRMGAPIGDLIIATNENDILVRLWETGDYHKEGAKRTHSPSMDIQISSNFERYLAMMTEGPERVTMLMDDLKRAEGFTLSPQEHEIFRQDFKAVAVSNEETRETMTQVWKDYKYALDPHTAVGYQAGLQSASGEPFVTLATAHPAKFPEIGLEAFGNDASGVLTLPKQYEGLMERPEKMTRLPADYKKLKEFIEGICR